MAVGTGQALEIGSKGDANVVLVHSRKGEDQFVADGHAKERFDVMYNDYIIVGPADDPAKIAGMATGKEAFQAIADAEATFVSPRRQVRHQHEGAEHLGQHSDHPDR